MTIGEYRKITEDEVSSDEIIKKRIDYITALCSNVIRQELDSFMRANRKDI